jgi:Ca2+-binding EF-hand superfamily protein
MKLKKMGGRINLTDLVERMRKFDPGDAGRIKIHHFINVLKHNYSEIFDNETLIGLQFELECLNSDDCIDYEEFVKIFLEKQAYQSRDDIPALEVKLDKRGTYQI